MRTLMEASGLLVLIVALSALFWMMTGGIQRGYECHEATLKEGEICLEPFIESDQYPSAVWVDARSRKAYNHSHYKDAIFLTNHPAEDWDALLEAAAPKLMGANPIVVYCSSEQCNASKEVAKRLRETGLSEQILVLRGGWEALQQSPNVELQTNAPN